MRALETNFIKSTLEHYNNTMYLMKDSRNEEEFRRRHAKQQELNLMLIEKKESERLTLLNELESLNQQYLNMSEL
jgi:hypothetical protein